MRFRIYFIERENVAVSFEEKLFIINPAGETNCEIRPEKESFVILTEKLEKIPENTIHPFMSNLKMEKERILDYHFDQEISLKFYINTEKSSAFLIKRGKFRIFYADSQYFKYVDSMELVIRDIKKFFVRKLDFAFLPLETQTDRVIDFLVNVKPKYFVPLLPEGNHRIIEDFVKDYKFVHTSVLLYSGNCETFEFNLI